MDETNMVNALVTVTTDAGITDAFQQGLFLGATIVAVLFAFSFMRLVVHGQDEEL